MASPFDLRKKNRQAALHQVREEARSRMETVAKLERRGTTAPKEDVIGKRTGKVQVIGPTEGRTGPAKPVNAERFPSIAGPRQAQAERRIWDIVTPGRGATRGTPLVRGDKMFYRRKGDGKAIPIDSTGRVIRRTGTSR